MNNILVTGGAGFIGSHLVRLLVNKYPDKRIVNFDKLTYAGNLENLKDVEQKANYFFVKADICDAQAVDKIFAEYKIDGVIHLAAESHVDRSITNPFEFARTNVMGTLTLLQTAKNFWQEDFANKLFYHISTDEVYGSLGKEGYFVEETPYDPKSPYSASKAASDHFVRAYANTFGLPTSRIARIITVRISFLKSFCRCLLTIFSKKSRCRFMERAKMCAIGFM